MSVQKTMAWILASALVMSWFTGLHSSFARETTAQTRSCTDGGGHVWSLRSVWGGVYTGLDGVQKVRNDVTGFTTTHSDSNTVDYSIKTYTGSGRLIQTLARNNATYNFAGGTAYLARNPLNAPAEVKQARIVVSVGDGNDGYGNCTVTFLQPAPATATKESVVGFSMAAALTADTTDFDRDLADLKASGAGWVRLGWAFWDVSDYRNGRWVWNETAWSRAASMIRKANDAGLNVYLHSAAIRDVPNLTLDQYIAMNRLYWRKTMEVAKSAGGVDIYQVYNEHNQRDFRTYEPVPQPASMTYLRNLGKAVAAARQEARQVDPNVRVTTTIYTNVNPVYWWPIYDVLAPSVDLIGLDTYPGTCGSCIDEMPEQIRSTERRYGKKVVIGEIGLPLYSDGPSASVVGTYLARMITRAAEGEPAAVLVYALRNGGTNTSEPEHMFGIYNRDHTPRPIRDAVVAAVRES